MIVDAMRRDDDDDEQRNGPARYDDELNGFSLYAQPAGQQQPPP